MYCSGRGKESHCQANQSLSLIEKSSGMEFERIQTESSIAPHTDLYLNCLFLIIECEGGKDLENYLTQLSPPRKGTQHIILYKSVALSACGDTGK